MSSNSLAEYLAALEMRDGKEKAHEEYIIAYSKLADRTAALANQAASSADEPAPSPSVSVKTIRPGTPKGKTAVLADVSSPSSLAQIRAELATTQRTRSTLESQLSTLTTELATLKAADTQKAQRIEQLEKVRSALERRGKDRADELKGKGRFVEEVQDEMVALNLQLSMSEQENEKLKRENADLTQRWVKKMGQEAESMNVQMGWEAAQTGRRKGSRS